MKKLLFCFILIVISNLYSIPVFSQTLVGGIIYNVQEARAVSFRDVSSKIDTSGYRAYFQDKNIFKNRKFFLKNRNKDMVVTKFSDGGYSIRYKKIQNPCFYYTKNGQLEYMGFLDGTSYPRKYLKYDKEGNLLAIDLDVSDNEHFVFDNKKNLLAHWIGNNCYNENGELILTRE